MQNISKKDVERMVGIIEYIVSNDTKVSVDQVMKDCDLTFEEYRLMSALAMPTIRRRNDYLSVKSMASRYKALWNQEKADRERTDEVLAVAKNYLDRRFAAKPKAVVKSVEEEAMEHGDDNDPA